MPFGRGSNDTMFLAKPFNLSSFIEDCKSMYGVPPRPHWVTTYYGGHDINMVLKRFASNIIFSNGLRDPYSSGGALCVALAENRNSAVNILGILKGFGNGEGKGNGKGKGKGKGPQFLHLNIEVKLYLRHPFLSSDCITSCDAQVVQNSAFTDADMSLEETPEITPTVDEAVLSPVNQDTITPLPSESDTMEPKEMLLSDEEKERNSAEEEKLEESPIDEEAAHNSSVVPAISIAVRQFGRFLRELSHTEVGPWSKTGGLGDVLGGLPPAMAIGMGQMDHYENDFEADMLKDTAAYYSRKASNWILEDSCPDYMLKHKDVTKRPVEETPEITPTVDEVVLSPVNQDTITPLPSESDTMEPKEMLLSDEEKERNSAEEEKLEESPIDEEAAHNSSVVPAISIVVRQFGRFLRELSHSTQSASIAELCIILAFGRVGGDVEEVLPPVLDSSSDPPPLFDGTTRTQVESVSRWDSDFDDIFQRLKSQKKWSEFSDSSLKTALIGLQEKIKLVPIDLQNRPDWYKEKHQFYGKSIPFGAMEEALNNETTRGYFHSTQVITAIVEYLHFGRRIPPV
ncbi:hypothetical protein TEA_014318 [Camellia sinensis var. sinensis]|uniref:Uncharacterized protein n=1 Tax=Camellia sinensis var. sinensis TaxID=542762 RepID=A0A4S4EC70_CAMSN|nr:hypothetical protein TEA_014318 [Camellia sinensis var. sinensis]